MYRKGGRRCNIEVGAGAEVKDLVRLDSYQISVISDQEARVRKPGGQLNYGRGRGRRAIFKCVWQWVKMKWEWKP
jgi:hypothetical protein